jgi:hypothetical protein
MNRTLLVLIGLALSTTACGRIADEAKHMLSIEDDATSLEVNEGDVRIGSSTSPTGHPSAKPAEAPTVSHDEVRVNENGTKVRTSGGNVDVSKPNGDPVKVKTDEGTRVEAGGVKVEGNKVTVPGVATVYGY